VTLSETNSPGFRRNRELGLITRRVLPYCRRLFHFIFFCHCHRNFSDDAADDESRNEPFHFVAFLNNVGEVSALKQLAIRVDAMTEIMKRRIFPSVRKPTYLKTSEALVPGYAQFDVTRQTTLPTSSATSKAPFLSMATPTGRPHASPSGLRKPLRTSSGAAPEGLPCANGTKITL